MKIADVTTDQWKRAINTEVNGFFAAAQASVLHMRDNGGGSLVHLGSAGDNKFPDEDVLSVSPKAANESLIQGIAREEGRNQIRANSVLVGVIEAGMFLELTKKGHFDETWVQEVIKILRLKDGVSLKRLVTRPYFLHPTVLLCDWSANICVRRLWHMSMPERVCFLMLLEKPPAR